MEKEMLDWITQLIRENDVHRFYASPVWRKKQAQILRENHYISTHTPLTGRDRYILYLCNGTFPHIGTDLFLLISFI